MNPGRALVLVVGIVLLSVGSTHALAGSGAEGCSLALRPTAPASSLELMPIHPDVERRIKAEGYDSVTILDLRNLAELKQSQGIDQPEPIPQPVTGLWPALVLLVDYSDITHNGLSTPILYNNLLFSVGGYPAPGSMRDFFREASYGVFDIIGGVDNTWRQVSNPRNYYANFDGIGGTDDDYGFGAWPNNAQKLVVDAVTLADNYVNFANYAVGGQVQGLFVIHAGRGAETDQWSYDWIWSHKWGLGPYALTVDGVVVNLYSMEPEYVFSPGDSTVGVFCHEYGHVLGLPDLYDTDYTSQGLGDWSLMAYGAWTGWNGNSPAHPDAWSKIQLGWVTPTIPTGTQIGASLPNVEGSATVYKLWTNGSAGTQYFLLENRQRRLFDTGLPSDGLLLYHVDETADQTSDWQPKVMLEQADGLWDLQYGTNTGDSGDPYPGSSNNLSATAATTPSTKSYANANTYVSITNISSSGLTMTADLSVGAPPAAPSALVATAFSNTRIDLSWTDNSANETGFQIWRKTTASGTYSLIFTTGANVVAYANTTGLTASTTYYYKVRAYKAAVGYSAYCTEKSATTYALPAPSNLAATAFSNTQINLGWTDNSTGETGFKIERKPGVAGAWSTIFTTVANVVTYQSIGLTANTTYYYRVRAYNAVGNSAYCTQKGAKTYALAAPSGLVATAVSNTRIDLKWTDNTTTETGFKIERKTGVTGAWSEIFIAGANVITYQNIALPANTTYYYRVRAYNALGTSAYSNVPYARTYALPAPSGLTATVVSSTQINLSWTDNSTGETGFKIERKTGLTGTYSYIGTVGASVVTYQNTTGLIPNTGYYYRVRAYNALGNSNYSNQAGAKTLP